MAKNDKGDKLFVDFVSQDKDWKSYVSNELKCQESWHRDWGFLADDTVTEKPLTKIEKIHVLEEKLRAMKDVNFISTTKNSYQGGKLDFKIEHPKKPTPTEIMPQTRRPKAISKTKAHFDEKMGAGYDYEKE